LTLLWGLTLSFTETDPLDAPTPSETPFSNALDAFDPAAEPFAGMDFVGLCEEERRCLAAKDIRRCWTARLHQAHRMPPSLRFFVLVNYSVAGYLRLAEDEGRLPRGWSAQRATAVERVTATFQPVARMQNDPDLPGMSIAEMVATADEVAAEFAAALLNAPEQIDRFADQLGVPLDPHPSTWN